MAAPPSPQTVETWYTLWLPYIGPMITGLMLGAAATWWKIKENRAKVRDDASALREGKTADGVLHANQKSLDWAMDYVKGIQDKHQTEVADMRKSHESQIAEIRRSGDEQITKLRESFEAEKMATTMQFSAMENEMRRMVESHAGLKISYEQQISELKQEILRQQVEHKSEIIKLMGDYQTRLEGIVMKGPHV